MRSLHRALGHAPDARPRTGPRTATTAPPRPQSPASAHHRLSPQPDAARSGSPRALRDGLGRRPAPALRVAAHCCLAVAAVAAVTRSPAAVPVLAAGLVLTVGASLVDHPRAADRALAAFVAVLLLPLLLLIGVAVRLTSRGPALVRHPRTDADGGRVAPLRFRTSSTTAGPAREASPDTPVGQVLRRFSLDELPRLVDAAMGRTPFLRVSRR
ncbi:hypothetical protein GCU60_00595 [Blastococcus saxobsidens]|uniref:Bacterial sugar transferase domain-containing protein n=1 Tax=Blastococcus saxobsidens TaxID=138336 RepID=A0A6L9VWX4_9ACTN|nr:sugar transferase [Blastococcus saxobsidens]NEK84275.1 hypothetical protein [Blastococcus saxobsidens]